jgi:hypothetical protein
VPPVDNETYQYFTEKYQSYDCFRTVDEISPKVTHAGASHHLSEQAKGDDKIPYPCSFVVESFQAADALFIWVLFRIVFQNFFARKSTLHTFFADDLECGGNDGNQQGYEPQTQYQDADNEEEGADEIIGVRYGIEYIGPGVGRHDDED